MIHYALMHLLNMRMKPPKLAIILLFWTMA